MPRSASALYRRPLTAATDYRQVMRPAGLVDRASPESVLPARTGFKGARAPWADVGDDGIRPGLSTKVPDGAYRGVVPPPRRDIFLKGLRAGLRAHPEMRRTNLDPASRRHKDTMSLDRCMLLFELETLAAQPVTGRDMRALQAGIAKAAGCTVKDVQRFHRLASRVMQVMVPIAEGRLLTLVERLDVWNRQTSPRLKQHGVPSVWAFHVPAWLRPYMAAAAIRPPSVDNSRRRRGPAESAAPHPRSGHALEMNHPSYPSPSEPTSSKGGSLRSPSGPGSARTASTRTGRASPARQLAEKLVKAWPLLRSTHPQRLTPVLIPFVESRLVWDEYDLLDALQDRGEISGLGVPSTAYGIDTPWAYARALIEQLHPHDHPRLATVAPAEFRCGRSECDHGWITDPDSHVQELLGLRPNPPRRCDQCRPGAWPDPEPTIDDLLNGAPVDDQEPPF